MQATHREEFSLYADQLGDRVRPNRLARWRAAQVARIQHRIARIVAWTATRAWQVTADWRAVRPLISRTSAHFAILALAVAAFVLSGIELPQASLASAVGNTAVDNALQAVEAAPAEQISPAQIVPLTYIDHGKNPTTETTVVRWAQPHTEIPIRPRRGVITYTVQPGDTAESIAESFRLEATTIVWSNPDVEDTPDLLRIGQVLNILPVDGVYHTVKEDDTLESIAEKYKVEVDAIVDLSYNDLQPPNYSIQPEMQLIVPGGSKPYVPKRVTAYAGPIPEGTRGTGLFVWPVQGVITQWYWWAHRAIDIGAPVGSAVVASDGGYVSFAGWTDIGYGYLIVIDHANSYATYYAHLSQIYVAVGQGVSRGQVIGAVGSTGNSTGPHLHFEIRYTDILQNPLVYLP